MAVSQTSNVFESLDPDNSAGIDDWKMERLVEATAGYIIDLASRWDLDANELLSDSRPLTVRVGDSRARMDEDTVQFTRPDLYRAIMRNNYDDARVQEAVNEQYPVQFHQVPEEVGQLIGERMDNSWEFTEDLESVARDELHGNLAKMEYFPWFVELQQETWERDLEILKRMNDEEEIEYLESVQEDLDPMKEELERIRRTANESFYDEARKINILYRIGEIMENSPRGEFIDHYNSKQQGTPQPLSRSVLQAYTPVDVDVSLDEGVYEENIDIRRDIDYETVVEEMEEFEMLDEEELRDVRDSSLEYDSRTDRAYLIATRMARDIEDHGVSAGEVINSDEKATAFIEQEIRDMDQRVRAEYGV